MLPNSSPYRHPLPPGSHPDFTEVPSWAACPFLASLYRGSVTREGQDPVKGAHLLYGRPQCFWIGRVGMQASEPTLAPSGEWGQLCAGNLKMLRRPRGEQADSAGSGFRCSRQQKPMKSSGHKVEGSSPTSQSLCIINQGQDSDPLEKEPEWPKWSSAPLPGGELHV